MLNNEKKGFFCELKPQSAASNIPADLKLVNNYYFELLSERKFKVRGYNSNGLMKEGHAELVEYEDDGAPDIQGGFIEGGKEISFKIEPLNLFDSDVFFGSGVWIEYGANKSIRQKYNIKIWDAFFVGQDFSFLNNLFEKNKELASKIDEFEAGFKKQELSLEKLIKSTEEARVNIENYNAHSDELAESLAETKSLLKEAKFIEKDLNSFKTRIEAINEENVSLKNKYGDLIGKSEALAQSARNIQAKADDILGSAVTVQLAKSFKERKEAAATQRDKYDNTFYISLGIGAFVAFVIFFSSNNELDSFWDYVQFFATRLPLLVIPLWLGIFASKKSSYLTRLEEFYAQKQTLAESYEGYKSRLSEIGDDASEDLLELMRINLLSISRDSKSVIDGAAKEKHGPIEELLALRKKRESSKDKAPTEETGS
ncbi:hypothetical protein ACQKD0_13190 [Vreelandella aquamarina]|uniref:hypothetical protein n=1 Tax=Vreelandella aquamarina TaxID=77097 RepID=UPI003D06AA6C